MSYLGHEHSVSDSQPVELYKFVGTYANYCYTSGPVDVVYDDGGGDGPLTYTAISIDRSEVNLGTQEDDNLDVTVTMGVLQQIAIDYAFTISPPDLELIIYRQQPDETIVYWKGPINNVTIDPTGRAQFRNPSHLGNALQGNIPNIYYQSPCNNVLYGPQCKVDFALWSEATTVTGVSADGLSISVASIGTLDGKMGGGEIALASGERRMIVSNTGTVLTVNFPFAKIIVGGACELAAGCDQDYTGDCKTKFNNQVNFCGFRFIPSVNPFASGLKPGSSVADDACVFTHVISTFWVSITLDFTAGAFRPHLAPGWGFKFKKAGAIVWPLSGDLSPAYFPAGNYTVNSPDGVHVDGITFYAWKTGNGPVGATTFATDPLAGGFDAVGPVNLQWTYGEFSFPEGDGAMVIEVDHGGASSTFMVGGAPLPIYGLFPIGPNDFT